MHIQRGDELPLSEREIEIARLVMRGLSGPEIGRKLGISHRTVEVHMRHGKKKLGTRNVAEFVRILITGK